MTVTKSEIQEAYNDMLKALIEANERMDEFMHLTDQLEGESWQTDIPEGFVKFDARNLHSGLYSKIRDFLQDMNISLSSSDIQNHIDALPDDEEEDEDENET